MKTRKRNNKIDKITKVRKNYSIPGGCTAHMVNTGMCGRQGSFLDKTALDQGSSFHKFSLDQGYGFQNLSLVKGAILR